MGPTGGATTVPITPPASLFPGTTGALSAAGPGAIGTATSTMTNVANGVDVSKIYQSVVDASKTQEATGRSNIMSSMGASGMASSSDAMKGLSDYENQFQANLLSQLSQMQFQNEQIKMSGATGLMDTYANAGMAFAPTEAVVGNSGQSVFGQTTGAVAGAATLIATLMAAGCWVAAELYGGWGSLEVYLLRSFFISRRDPFGKSLVFLYVKFGQRLAKLIKTHRLLRAVVKFVFDKLMTHAYHWRFQCLDQRL